MASFQGQRVSTYWQVVLTEAARHVNFRLNDGQRTLADQERMVREKGVWSPSNPHGAARPNADAPHIKRGQPHHALDIDMYYGDGVAGVARWLKKQGVQPMFTVPTEGWHLELTLDDLRKLYRRFNKFAHYTTSERRWMAEYDAKPSPARKRVLKRVMKEQRKEIWRAAKKSGWGKLNRRRRYTSMLVRSR